MEETLLSLLFIPIFSTGNIGTLSIGAVGVNVGEGTMINYKSRFLVFHGVDPLLVSFWFTYFWCILVAVELHEPV
jgi:hypothetical protein